MMRWSDYLPEGWRKTIGDELNELLKQYCIMGGEVVQVKEKFGGLRIYTNGEFALDYSRISNICDNTCMRCTKPGRMTTVRGWIGPRCEEHSKPE
jgi:hypothetical protein